MSYEIRVIQVAYRKGEGWYARGDRLSVCARDSYYKAHKKGEWEGTRTSPPLVSLLPTCYMTKSLWDSLSQELKIQVAPRVIDIVGPGFARQYTKYTAEGKFYCRAFVPDSIIEGYKEESIIICTEGEKRNPKTCWDGSKIYQEVCKNNKWVPSGETCPPEPEAGAKRGPTTCWDRSVIHAEVYDAALHRWVPSGEKCPPKPECTEGDKKPGHVCENGKWVEVAEPVVEEPEVEEPCYIKFDVPWLDLLPGIPCPWWVLPVLPGLKKTKKP